MTVKNYARENKKNRHSLYYV